MLGKACILSLCPSKLNKFYNTRALMQDPLFITGVFVLRKLLGQKCPIYHNYCIVLFFRIYGIKAIKHS